MWPKLSFLFSTVAFITKSMAHSTDAALLQYDKTSWACPKTLLTFVDAKVLIRLSSGLRTAVLAGYSIKQSLMNRESVLVTFI